MAADAPEIAIALPALIAGSKTPPVPHATDGMAEAYLALAATLRQQDSGDFAMVLLRLALDLRPDFTAARILAADILENGQHLENALQMLAPVARRPAEPGDPAAARRADRAAGPHRGSDARIAALAHDYPDSPLPPSARAICCAASSASPMPSPPTTAPSADQDAGQNDWLVFYDRGICYERSHQWPKAEADFKHALTLSPDQPFVLNYLGYSWADMSQNLPQARQMIEKALQRRPNDGAIVDSLGWVMLRQGQTADAVKTLERAVELEPEDASINGHLGDAYWAAGRKLEAAYQWRRALTFNPEPDDAAKLEAKLHTSARHRRWSAANNGLCPTTLTEPAPAKINLFLHVTGRRADGYHLLDSLAVFAASAMC